MYYAYKYRLNPSDAHRKEYKAVEVFDILD